MGAVLCQFLIFVQILIFRYQLYFDNNAAKESYLVWEECVFAHYDGVSDKSWQSVCGVQPSHNAKIINILIFFVLSGGTSALPMFVFALFYRALFHQRVTPDREAKLPAPYWRRCLSGSALCFILLLLFMLDAFTLAIRLFSFMALSAYNHIVAIAKILGVISVASEREQEDPKVYGISPPVVTKKQPLAGIDVDDVQDLRPAAPPVPAPLNDFSAVLVTRVGEQDPPQRLEDQPEPIEQDAALAPAVVVAAAPTNDDRTGDDGQPQKKNTMFGTTGVKGIFEFLSSSSSSSGSRSKSKSSQKARENMHAAAQLKAEFGKHRGFKGDDHAPYHEEEAGKRGVRRPHKTGGQKRRFNHVEGEEVSVTADISLTTSFKHAPAMGAGVENIGAQSSKGEDMGEGIVYHHDAGPFHYDASNHPDGGLINVAESTDIVEHQHHHHHQQQGQQQEG
jgi:hypothetical protein